MSTFEEILKKDGILVYKTKGVSMKPMLHQNRDLVIIRVPEGRLSRFDVALYRRGKQYVLHRVLQVRERDYLIRGDNTFVMETVPEENVIGVLTEFVRKGRHFSVTDRNYLRYVSFWNAIYPVRAVYSRGRRFAARIAHKMGYHRKKR